MVNILQHPFSLSFFPYHKDILFYFRAPIFTKGNGMHCRREIRLYFCIVTQCIYSIFYRKVIKYTPTYIYICMYTYINMCIHICMLCASIYSPQHMYAYTSYAYVHGYVNVHIMYHLPIKYRRNILSSCVKIYGIISHLQCIVFDSL